MIIATFLELATLFTMLGSADHRTRIIGSLLWCAYLRYSATRAACEAFAEWWDDFTNPPGGAA